MRESPEAALAVAAALLAISLLALLLRRDLRVAILLAGGAVLVALASLARISDEPSSGRAWAVIAAIFLVAGLLDRRGADVRKDDP